MVGQKQGEVGTSHARGGIELPTDFEAGTVTTVVKVIVDS